MMEKFQEYIEQNLPDRFRKLKVFRIPVNCDGINYWATYNNGTWKFDTGSNTSIPIITYTSTLNENITEDRVSSIESSEVLDNPAISPESIRRAKGKKEKPIKEKKERPVREKPVKEKKERPVRENRNNKSSAEIEQSGAVQDNNVFEAGCNYDEFEQSMNTTSCKFNMKCNMKQRKKLTGRIIFAALNILTGGLITGIASIITACNANSNIGNPIDYWHYRKVNSVWHMFVLLRLLIIIVLIILLIVAYVQIGNIMSSIAQSLM